MVSEGTRPPRVGARCAAAGASARFLAHCISDSRLKTFLSWKDVRKNVKDSDDKGGGDAGHVGDFEEVRILLT